MQDDLLEQARSRAAGLQGSAALSLPRPLML